MSDFAAGVLAGLCVATVIAETVRLVYDALRRRLAARIGYRCPTCGCRIKKEEGAE